MKKTTYFHLQQSVIVVCCWSFFAMEDIDFPVRLEELRGNSGR